MNPTTADVYRIPLAPAAAVRRYEPVMSGELIILRRLS